MNFYVPAWYLHMGDLLMVSKRNFDTESVHLYLVTGLWFKGTLYEWALSDQPSVPCELYMMNFTVMEPVKRCGSGVWCSSWLRNGEEQPRNNLLDKPPLWFVKDCREFPNDNR